jgi:hypothetical protein
MIAHDVNQVAPDATAMAKRSMSELGTFLPCRDVGSSVAVGGSPDMTRAVHFDGVHTAKNEQHLLSMDWQDLETFSFGDGPDLDQSAPRAGFGGTKRAICLGGESGPAFCGGRDPRRTVPVSFPVRRPCADRLAGVRDIVRRRPRSHAAPEQWKIEGGASPARRAPARRSRDRRDDLATT